MAGVQSVSGRTPMSIIVLRGILRGVCLALAQDTQATIRAGAGICSQSIYIVASLGFSWREQGKKKCWNCGGRDFVLMMYTLAPSFATINKSKKLQS